MLAAGYFVLPSLRPAPPVTHPANADLLDPAVEALLQPLLSAAEREPRAANHREALAIAYEANGLWPEARSAYANTLALGRETPAWALHHAIAIRQADGFEPALENLRDLARRHEAFAPIQQRFGEMLLEAGELKEAEAAFRQLLTQEPRAVQGFTGLGDALVQQDRAEEAVRFLEEAIRIRPDYQRAHFVLGQAYQQLGRTEEAQASMQQGQNGEVVYLADDVTRQIRPYLVNYTSRQEQANAFLDAGQPEQAAQLLEETYTYHPSNTMLLNTLGVAYLFMRR